jgi:membrane protease YdiL (CAAX protease family)
MLIAIIVGTSKTGEAKMAFLSNEVEPEKKKPAGKNLGKTAFVVGLIVILVSVYAQYVIPGLNLISGTLLVYGLPILVTSVIWGRTIIAKALRHMYTAVRYGLGYFGIFTVIGLGASILILLVLTLLDPSAINLLHKPNPVLQVSPELAWFMVGFSFLVVGPSEEYLFRGFVFGGLLNVLKGRHWLFLAFVSSIFFAGVHLYYAVVYGVASLVQFADLITFGMAMAATYYASGGNLLVPAMIHGAYDATGYVGVATSSQIGAQLREVMILIGLIAAFIVFSRRKRNAPADESG